MKNGGRAQATVNDRTGWRELMHDNDEAGGRNSGEGKMRSKDGHAVLSREAQGRIGQHLRRVYGEILAEPLPDKFTKLLDELAKTERGE